ncbi:aldo/keto reductase [Kiritimatiella glycovorans]|uniref:L-glyceraldehyde 3-phosphate reductase n=1 Tax=Kiritimatiella glycovorans TaxID=1307763 RepID=A0A0G3EJM2_9BACT|nr:aldo/keto reductase [Kiritimatiella glycovorans]AKJ64324.1 L-glyceraldehyde 3-phosphate reductase [Kiritimatiella glycovorans]
MEDDRYQSMPYRRCGHSGLSLPAVSLGLWHNFGADDDRDHTREIIRTAFDHGITHFDLANNYGPPPGEAEVRFGEILQRDLAGHRDELIISTKAGFPMWPGPYGDGGSRKYLIASLDQSLRRMDLEYVDIFYHHRPDPGTPVEETVGALAHAVHSGKALYAGISSYSAEETRTAAAYMREAGIPCLIHQVQYHMLLRDAEDALFDTLEDEGIGAIAFCPLAQGLLTSKYLEGIPEGSRAAREGTFLDPEQIDAKIQKALREMNEIAAARGQTLARMAVSWVLRDPRMTSALIGASRADQVVENCAATQDPPFDVEELRRIDRILQSVS